MRRARLGDAHPTDGAGDREHGGNAAARRQIRPRPQPLYREGLARQRKVYGNEHPLVATTVGNLALVEHELHNEREAERLFREAIAISARRYGESSSRRGDLDVGPGQGDAGAEAYAEAERLFRHAIDIERAALGEQHPASASTRATWRNA